MPLRDHFHPPVSRINSWEEIHGMWPAMIVQSLKKQLPPGFACGPRVHSGAHVEVDVAAYEQDGAPAPAPSGGRDGAAPLWTPAEPCVAVETDLSEYDEYEVRVYDARREQRLVAAVELVSPANKDREEHRNVFVAKCAALLQKGVAVTIVDVITERRFNLYDELLTLIGHADPTLGDPPPQLYAASCRWVEAGKRTLFEAWSHPLEIDRPLPTLPLWIAPERVVPLYLEESYEQAFSAVQYN